MSTFRILNIVPTLTHKINRKLISQMFVMIKWSLKSYKCPENLSKIHAEIRKILKYRRRDNIINSVDQLKCRVEILSLSLIKSSVSQVCKMDFTVNFLITCDYFTYFSLKICICYTFRVLNAYYFVTTY